MVLKSPTLTAPRHSFNAAKNAHSNESSHGHPPNLSIFSLEMREIFCQSDLIQSVSEAVSLISRWKRSKS